MTHNKSIPKKMFAKCCDRQQNKSTDEPTWGGRTQHIQRTTRAANMTQKNKKQKIKRKKLLGSMYKTYTSGTL